MDLETDLKDRWKDGGIGLTGRKTKGQSTQCVRLGNDGSVRMSELALRPLPLVTAALWEGHQWAHCWSSWVRSHLHGVLIAPIAFCTGSLGKHRCSMGSQSPIGHSPSGLSQQRLGVTAVSTWGFHEARGRMSLFIPKNPQKSEDCRAFQKGETPLWFSMPKSAKAHRSEHLLRAGTSSSSPHTWELRSQYVSGRHNSSHSHSCLIQRYNNEARGTDWRMSTQLLLTFWTDDK